MKKKILLIILIAILLIVIIKIVVDLNSSGSSVQIATGDIDKQNNEQNIHSNLQKIKEYAETLDYFDYKNEIRKNGYISEDDALKIIATSTVSRGNQDIKMKEYIKTVNSIKIELIDNNKTEELKSSSISDTITIGEVKSQGTYWKIILHKNSSSYFEKAQYYTGEILFGKVTEQMNID